MKIFNGFNNCSVKLVSNGIFYYSSPNNGQFARHKKIQNIYVYKNSSLYVADQNGRTIFKISKDNFTANVWNEMCKEAILGWEKFWTQ
jgi:hypothetical protein